MENLVLTNGCLDSHDDGAVKINSVAKENENLNVVKENENLNVVLLFEDLDSYLNDINDRLTVSRMVSDSVIRGMVNAVEQEACEKIARKEMEVSKLKETLHLYHVGADENETSGYHLMLNEVPLSFQDVFVGHDKLKGSLGDLQITAKNQLKMLMEEINKLKGLKPMKGTNISVEILGLGGILLERASDKWMGVDEMLNSLNSTLDGVFKQMDHIINLSGASLLLWQQELDFQEEVEHMVIANLFRCLKDEFEKKLWLENTRYCGNVNSLEKIKEISSLRQELDLISKSLSAHENGQSMFHGFVEPGEEWTQKRMDRLHGKVSGSISSASLAEVNGKHEELVTSATENLDALRHMSSDELIHHFKTEINNMKRDHDYRTQEMTEELFRLKRDYLKLKEGGSFSTVKRDKEIEALKKKIPDAILKLDKILSENEKIATLGNNDASLGTLKGRLDPLLLENHQLRDLLADKKKEVSGLRSQVSKAAEKISQLSQTEESLLKLAGELESTVEDSRIEAYITENMYACFLWDSMVQIGCITEESDLEGHMMREVYELICRDVPSKWAPKNVENFEDSFMESSLTQDLLMVIFKEAVKEAEEKLGDLNMECINESGTLASLKMDILEKENALTQEVREKERLKQDILLLKDMVEAKEKLVHRTEDALAKETESLGLTSQELTNLRNLTSQQERTILENNDELKVVKGELVEALEVIKVYEVEKHDWRQKLKLAREELKKTNDERIMLLAATQEKHHKLSTVEANEKENRKQLESLIVFCIGLIKEFTNVEHRVTEKLWNSNSRLKNLHGQMSSLADQADELKATRLMYKQLYERKRSDLQKAEAEVDLLGDDVNALVDLLEKIYLALDHYSPILKHYPGIIEILKLVRRELRGESRRLV